MNMHGRQNSVMTPMLYWTLHVAFHIHSNFILLRDVKRFMQLTGTFVLPILMKLISK